MAREYTTRARSFVRLLRELGMAVPERIDAQIFADLAREIASVHGLDLSLDGDPLRLDEVDPKVLRVRTRKADPLPAAAPDDGPPSLEPSVEIVHEAAPARVHLAPPVEPRQLSLLRLELLTSVADIDRPERGDWPSAFVTAASAGLSLSEDDGRVLRRIATAYSVGAHGARNILQRLAETTDGDAAAHLLGSMIELNRGRPHETERVLAIAEAVLGATVTQSARALAARPTSAEPQALDEISVTAPDGPADVATRDVRHMGALDNLFGRSKQ